jgi:hypothetical protein
MAKREKWQCTQPCFHNNHRFFLGDTVTATAEMLPQNKDGEVVHFRKIEGDEEEVVIPGATEVKVNEKKRQVKQGRS